MDSGLKGAVTLIVGGAGEIGSAIVNGFSEEHARLVVADVNPDHLSNLRASLNYPLETCLMDVRSEASIKEAVAFTLKTFGRIDVLVNVAGILNRKGLFEVEKEDIEASFSVNVTGALLLGREVARVMKTQKSGRIINITSLNGSAAVENRVIYGASKAALDMVTRTMAIELGGYGITVNAVAPGVVDSAMSRVRLNNPQVRAEFERYIPLGRLVTPEDVSGSVLFLASRYASCITGTVLLVDGGVIARQALPRL